MGFEFIKSGTVCAGFSAYLQSGDFFEGLSSQDTDRGRKFRRKSLPVEAFPERLEVTVLVSLVPCARTDPSREKEESAEPKFTLDADFIQSLQFEGFWKTGFDMRKADAHIMTLAQTKAPSSLGRDSFRWEYMLDIQSRDVPLTNALVIAVSSADGRLISRFSACL